MNQTANPAGARRPARKPRRGKTGNGAPPSLMRDVMHTVLANGLRVFLVESHELPVVCHMLWYTVGARDERTGETGCSHFLEHMMFKGTDRWPKGSIDLTTMRLGGHNNAFTDNDCTAYFFNLKSDRWTEALAIEQSRMRDCLIAPFEFDSEKKVVIEELQMGEDEPWRPLYQAVETTAYQVHPYRHPVIGWREDLERLTRDSMHAYYQRHYTPDRAILVVVGDIDGDAALRHIESTLGQVKPSGQARAAVLTEPVQKGERRVEIRFPGNLPRLGLAWHTCRVGDPDDVVLDVVGTLLSSGKSSRLYRGIVQGRELAASVQAQNEARLDPGLFWVLAEGKPDTKPEKLEAAVLAEIDRLATDGPDRRELDRCKKQILTSFFFDLETVSDQAMRLGRHEVSCQDGWRVLERYPEDLRAIGAKEVKAAMRKYFTRDNRSIGWSLPGGNATSRGSKKR